MQQYPETNQERAYMHQYQNQYGQYAPQGQIIQNNPYASQPQAVPRQTYLKGRVVNSDADIRPNEVPMDGTASFFPRADGQVVYVKWWGNNGLIEGRTFVPSQDTTVDDASSNNDANKKLDDILDRLGRMEKRLGKPFNPHRNNQQTVAKKEDESHD